MHQVKILTTSVFPFARSTLLINFRSMLLAAMENNHGATLNTDDLLPLFPAAWTVSIPSHIAWKEPIAIESESKGVGPIPIEMVMMSTPSAIASSKAARILYTSALSRCSATLYAAILADGTPPRAFPFANP